MNYAVKHWSFGHSASVKFVIALIAYRYNPKNRMSTLPLPLREAGKITDYALAQACECMQRAGVQVFKTLDGVPCFRFTPSPWGYSTPITSSPHRPRMQVLQHYRHMAAASKVQPKIPTATFEQGLPYCDTFTDRMLWLFCVANQVPFDHTPHHRFPLRAGCVYFSRKDFCDGWRIPTTTFDTSLKNLRGRIIDVRFARPLYMVEVLPEIEFPAE